jgi:nucleotide-binding universal stress UspA family protein
MQDPIPGTSTPDSDMPLDGGRGPVCRVLVPIDSYGASCQALGLAIRMGQTVRGPLRLVYVRIWDPGARGMGKVFLESSEEATAVLDAALSWTWACGVEASGVVVDAARPLIARAIVQEASNWGADVIVLTQRPRRFITVGLWDRVAREVMRATDRPVLVAHPNRA